MVGVRYTICHWATHRTDSQNLLSTTLDILLHLGPFEVIGKLGTHSYLIKLPVRG